VGPDAVAAVVDRTPLVRADAAVELDEQALRGVRGCHPHVERRSGTGRHRVVAGRESGGVDDAVAQSDPGEIVSRATRCRRLPTAGATAVSRVVTVTGTENRAFP
jgi:hypothetical protein